MACFMIYLPVDVLTPSLRLRYAIEQMYPLLEEGSLGMEEDSSGFYLLKSLSFPLLIPILDSYPGDNYYIKFSDNELFVQARERGKLFFDLSDMMHERKFLINNERTRI